MIWASQLQVLFLLTLYSFSVFSYKECNQSDFAIDHIVHVLSCLLCCWKRIFTMIRMFSWQNSISICPASFCIPRPNLPVTQGISWLPILHSNPLWWKGHIFLVLVLEGLVSLHRTFNFFSISGWGIDLDCYIKFKSSNETKL